MKYRAMRVGDAVHVATHDHEDCWDARMTRSEDGTMIFEFAYETAEQIGDAERAVSFGEAIAEAARMLASKPRVSAG